MVVVTGAEGALLEFECNGKDADYGGEVTEAELREQK